MILFIVAFFDTGFSFESKSFKSTTVHLKVIMKLKLEKGDLSVDFEQNSPEAFSLLVEMIQLLSSRKAINSGSILKVSGLTRSLNLKLMSDLCSKLGYMFLAVALAETGEEEYTVEMSLSPRFPVGSVLNNPPEQ